MSSHSTFSISDEKCATCRFWEGERTIDFVANKPRYIKANVGSAACSAQNNRNTKHIDRCLKYMKWEKLP